LDDPTPDLDKEMQLMNEQQRQAIANFRYGLIAPIVSRTLEPREQAQMLKQIIAHEYTLPDGNRKRFSRRTVERYLHAYRSHGWDGLKPSHRADRLLSRELPQDLLKQAVALKKEQPVRSVRQIIAILELSGHASPGALKESTLSRHLRRKQATRKQLAMSNWSEHRRFEAAHRNAIWQGDVQHTLHLPHPDRAKEKAQAYLIAFIDDYSRYVVHAQFYFEERKARLEDCLKRAILKNGIPQAIYVDNGSIYSSKDFDRICGRLGTELRHSTPGRPQGRGKQEKFFRFVDLSFVPEAKDLIQKETIRTLADLNRFFQAWLEIAYHQKVHSTVRQRPIDRFQRCAHPIRRMEPHELVDVFLQEEQRTVDKTGCFQLFGLTFECTESLRKGEKITVRFDAYDLSEVQVWQDDRRVGSAKPLQPRDPNTERQRKNQQPPETSSEHTGLNYLELLQTKHEHQQQEASREGFITAMNGGEQP
jgi:putative transposase